jgi:hypothetical protein
MQTRLDVLEGVVAHMCKLLDLDMEFSSLAEFEASATEALTRFRPLPTKLATQATRSAMNRLTSSNSGVLHTSSNDLDSFKDAPLVNLFNDAMMIEKDENQTSKVDFSKEKLEHHIDPCIQNVTRSLACLVPSPKDLVVLLDATKRYWPTWPVSPRSQLEISSPVQPGETASFRDIILTSFKSGSPLSIARSILWLTLSIQQLPLNYVKLQMKLAEPVPAVINSFMDGAGTILSSDEIMSGSIDALECLALQAKVYIDAGKPRQAWLSLRRALNFALLLGIDQLEDGENEHHRALWSFLWQSERQLSLVLGFPHALSESNPGLSIRHTGQSIASKVTHELGIIAGHIIERNQNHRNADYSSTLDIEQELKQCKDQIPSNWWDAVPTPGTTLEVLFGQQTIKMYYHQLRKTLHLPYIFKSSIDGTYGESKALALQASREMINCYQTLRNSSGQALIMCDLMDFQAFSSAVVIVIHLLLQNPATNVYQDVEDWKLVHCTIRNFEYISRKLECTVASQAAQLLENLSTAHHGSYDPMEDYEAVIPYFGKVRISRPSGFISQTESTLGSNIQSHEPQLQSNTIELSGSPFMCFNDQSGALYLSDAELGVDWTSIVDINTTYDWSQLFYNTASGRPS